MMARSEMGSFVQRLEARACAAISFIDLFAVRTISFKLLYAPVILRHARRRLVSRTAAHLA